MDLGIDSSLVSALTLIVTAVIVPAVTALLTSPRTPKRVKRALPLALAGVGAAIILLLRGDFQSLPHAIEDWIFLFATLVGMAQLLYSLMPEAWKSLSEATPSTTLPGGRIGDEGGTDG